MPVLLPARHPTLRIALIHRLRALGARPLPELRWLAAALLCNCAVVLAPAHAAGSEPAADDPRWLQEVRVELQAKRFDAALAVLKPANAVDNAEWHNLMGFALRSRSPADLAAAEQHYKRALEIEPRHRSALEYYGELMLMKKDLAGALAMQGRLERACRFGCPELKDLREAIARYRAAGGR